jgi:hypothetical protein
MSTIIKGKPPLPMSVNARGYTIHGKKYPRVTSILGVLNKPALVGWAAKSVAEFAVRHREVWTQLPDADAEKLLKGAPWSQRDEAADRGSAVHKVVEAYVTDQPLPDMTEDELECAIAAETFLRDHSVTVEASEITVYDDVMGYAGTCDLWCRIGGEQWLIDWKTSKGVYPEMAVQLVAYAEAGYALVGGHGVDWAGGVLYPGRPRLGVVHLRRDGYTLHEVVQDRDRLAGVWHAMLALHGWTKDMDSALEARTA